MSKMGFSEQEVELMTYTKYDLLFEEYAKTHNFETKRGLYAEERKIVSLMDI